MKTNLVLSLIACAFVAAPAGQAALISVNFNGFTGGNPGPTQIESTLEGPAGGLGTSWNQYAANSGSGLVDSTGAPTLFGFTTNFTEGRYDGTGPTQTMLRATLTDFGRGQSRTVSMTGLEAGGLYDIWLVSHRQQNGAQPNLRERQVGTWTSVNPTSSATSQLVDGRLSGANGLGNAFQEGVNYAFFKNVVADGSGNIVFQGQGATIGAGFPDDYRLHLSGFQVLQVPEPSQALLLGLGGLFVLVRRRR